MAKFPHITIEDAEASVRALDELRQLNDDPDRQAAYRLVLTEVHQVIRNARDISNGQSTSVG